MIEDLKVNGVDINYKLDEAMAYSPGRTRGEPGQILKNKIKKVQFNPQFNVVGDKAWIVIGEFELFGEIHEFIYVISDEKGEVEYTMNELGTKNPHIPESDETWDKFTDENIERMNNGEWDDKWDNY